MPRVTINNQFLDVPDGATILEAAQNVGITIPTLCHLKGHPALTSCMVCLVEIEGSARLRPSCATPIEDGMVVTTDTPAVQAARRGTLELLLSEHVGDCIGPCQSVCPAHMDIPTMIRHLAAGEFREAFITVQTHIALPAVLGRICPELCERGCRRAQRDAAVAICQLKRFTAEGNFASATPYQPDCRPATGKRVAIIGAGPAGVSAAYYLRQLGHACVLLDAAAQPGGSLRQIDVERLPPELLDADLARVMALDVAWRPASPITTADALQALCRTYDAVLLATGTLTPETAGAWGVAWKGKGLAVEHETLMTASIGVFACGNAVHPSKHAVHAVASGRQAAHGIDAYLHGVLHLDHARPFSTHIGHLSPDELALQVAQVSGSARVAPSGGAAGFSIEEAQREAARCLHCDCRKLSTCQLRTVAMSCGAHPARHPGPRKAYELETTPAGLMHEAGKCILCGRCVKLCEAAGEPVGLTITHRGFAAQVTVPFGEPLGEGMRVVAEACVAACPTGALAWKR
jgi:ferredoxin